MARLSLTVEPLTRPQLRALYPDFTPPPPLSHAEVEARARTLRGQALDLDHGVVLVETAHEQQIERAYDGLREREAEDEAAAYRDYLQRAWDAGAEPEDDEALFKAKWRYQRRRKAIESIDAQTREAEAARQDQAQAAREAEAEQLARAAVEAELERRAKIAAAEKTARAALRSGAEELAAQGPTFWRTLAASLGA